MIARNGLRAIIRFRRDYCVIAITHYFFLKRQYFPRAGPIEYREDGFIMNGLLYRSIHGFFCFCNWGFIPFRAFNLLSFFTKYITLSRIPLFRLVGPLLDNAGSFCWLGGEFINEK